MSSVRQAFSPASGVSDVGALRAVLLGMEAMTALDGPVLVDRWAPPSESCEAAVGAAAPGSAPVRAALASAADAGCGDEDADEGAEEDGDPGAMDCETACEEDRDAADADPAADVCIAAGGGDGGGSAAM